MIALVSTLFTVPGCTNMSNSSESRDTSRTLVQAYVLTEVPEGVKPVRSSHDSISDSIVIQELLDEAVETTSIEDEGERVRTYLEGKNQEAQNAVSSIPDEAKKVVVHKDRPFRLSVTYIIPEDS